jgi:hypothetical protein
MANSNYIKGRSREYKIKQELEKEGYPLVMRTAGSHSPVDIIAIKEMQVVEGIGLCMVGKLIQSKVSNAFKKIKKFNTSIETENGSILVERWEYPSVSRKAKSETPSKKTKTPVKTPRRRSTS